MSPTVPSKSERGSITVESALVLPVFVLMLCFAVWGISAVAAVLRCGDTARVAARAVTRGDSEVMARKVAMANAPRGAEIHFSREGELVRVVVSSDVRPFGSFFQMLPALPVSAEAAVPMEAGA